MKPAPGYFSLHFKLSKKSHLKNRAGPVFLNFLLSIKSSLMMTKRDSSSSSFSGIQLCFVSSTSFGFFSRTRIRAFWKPFCVFKKNRAYFERLVYFRLESEHLFKSDKYYIHILAIQECMEHFLRVPYSLPKKYDVHVGLILRFGK